MIHMHVLGRPTEETCTDMEYSVQTMTRVVGKWLGALFDSSDRGGRQFSQRLFAALERWLGGRLQPVVAPQER